MRLLASATSFMILINMLDPYSVSFAASSAVLASSMQTDHLLAFAWRIVPSQFLKIAIGD